MPDPSALIRSITGGLREMPLAGASRVVPESAAEYLARTNYGYLTPEIYALARSGAPAAEVNAALVAERARREAARSEAAGRWGKIWSGGTGAGVLAGTAAADALGGRGQAAEAPADEWRPLADLGVTRAWPSSADRGPVDLADPFERAAARQRRAVMPTGGPPDKTRLMQFATAMGNVPGHIAGIPERMITTLQQYPPGTSMRDMDSADVDRIIGGAVETAQMMGGKVPVAPGEVGLGAGLIKPVRQQFDLIKPSVGQRRSGILTPVRNEVPGIYGDPRAIAEEAAARLAPEHPALQQLFGVSRQDLYDIGQQGRRAGNIEPSYPTVANPRGSYAAEAVMNQRNANRLVNALGEAERYPQLIHGADAWYVMDPAYWRLVELHGPEQAQELYRQFNTITPMFSPGSPVPTELTRGTAANMMINRGEFPLFKQFANVPEARRATTAGFPPELLDVPGHLYHGGSQVPMVERYLQSGALTSSEPKVPLYRQASGVPEIGFQTSRPVPDTHFAVASGFGDVRRSKDWSAALSSSEYQPFGPWYAENVARPLGVEAVPAQARQWTVFGPQTGVKTDLGAPKLELLARNIWERAQQLGIDPARLRDEVLSGRNYASWLIGGVPAAGWATFGGGTGGATAPGADQL